MILIIIKSKIIDDEGRTTKNSRWRV